MKNNQRFSFQDLSYSILFMILVLYLLISVQMSAQPKFEEVIEVEVRLGDTLWSIADKYSEGIPIQSFITLLKLENNLNDYQIYPGQKLLVPQLQSLKKGVEKEDEGNHLLSSKY